MKKVLCVGHAAYDMTLVVDSFPNENEKYKVSYSIECGGGQAANAAYLLGSWNVPTIFVGCIGSDIYGLKIKEELNSVGINTTNLLVSPNSYTDKSYILVNKSNGSRTCFTEHFASKTRMKNTNFNRIEYILMDGYDISLSVEIIKNNPRAITILDAGHMNSSIIELCVLVDYLITSKSFAEDFTKTKIDIKDRYSIIKVFNILERSVKGKVIITLGEDGCIYKDNNIIKIMPGLKANVRDTTGAGDVFHGAFVYGLINNYNYEETIKICNIAGALSVENVGSRYSIPPLKKVMDIYRNVR